jgi:8-oxo-dGTP diphosphatase
LSEGPYRNPYPTTDVIVEIEGGIVLIERAAEPKGWALPGGFIDYGESAETGARREVLEETGLKVTLKALLGVYSSPERDPRQHNLSVVYIGSAEGTPTAGDDAAKAKIFSLDALPAPLCFDHAQILDDYRRFLKSGQQPLPS